MVEHAFSPEAVEAMRPGIQRTADELLEGMLKHDSPGDLVELFALPLPSRVGELCQARHTVSAATMNVLAL
eukprot:1155916-Pelagomonas_calceolata.AAC.13